MKVQQCACNSANLPAYLLPCRRPRTLYIEPLQFPGFKWLGQQIPINHNTFLFKKYKYISRKKISQLIFILIQIGKKH